MQLKQMLHDDDAVSPVIGVILMVAITVILAAVIASFVLGLGPGEAAPTASFDFEGGEDQISVTHSTGDKIAASDLSVSYDGPAGSAEFDFTGARVDSGSTGSLGSAPGVSEVSSGNTLTLNVPDGNSGDYDVSVIYDGGDQTSTLESATVTVSS